jgi:outer membrane receptor protein involved in Fe transport
VDQVVSAEAEQGILNIGNTKPYSGSLTALEGFLEAVVPLAEDLPMMKSLEFNGAVRQTDYDNSGTVTTWKAGLSWQLTPAFRLRATQSRDIRAPNLAELKTGLTLSFATIFDPVTGTQVPNVRAPSVGNPDLEPELGDTLTIGMVLTPESAPNLRVSVDWYDIDIEDAIGTVGPQSIVNFCFAGLQQACDAITRDQNGNLVEVRNTFLNLAAFATEGVDAEISYVLPLGTDAAGTIGLRLLATYVDEFINDNGIRVLDLTESVGSFSGNGGPQWRGTAMIDYLNGPLGLHLEARYIGKGVLEPVVIYSDESVDAWTVVNLAASYQLPFWEENAVEIFGKVQNLLDTDPSVAPSTTFPTERRIYDVLGRFYSMGVRVRF